MMRTYTRKRPHHQLIDDVLKLCRLCLNKAEEVLPIFSEDVGNVCATLALRIMICTGLEMSRDDCLPNFICKDCYDELDRYYRFRKRCEVTYQKLKSHVLAFKENQYKLKIKMENEIASKNMKSNVEDEINFVISFDKLSDGSIRSLNEDQINNISEKLQEIKSIENTENKDGEQTTNDQSQDSDVTDLDISQFLSTMLIQLGLVTQQEDGLLVMDNNIKTVELETGDGRQIMLELAEEDDSVEIHLDTEVIQQITSDSKMKEAPDISQVPDIPESDVSIKYVTSHYKEHHKRLLRDIVVRVKEEKEDKKELIFCNECGKRMATRSVLARHKRIHSGEKPYECTDCGRKFTQKEILSRHRLVHEESRPFKCESCPKSFTQRGALTSHARSHAAPGERGLELHRCDRCPKVFLYASGLSRHMMMHNGRIYVCGACSRQFADKSSLMRHLKNTDHGPKEAHT